VHVQPCGFTTLIERPEKGMTAGSHSYIAIQGCRGTHLCLVEVEIGCAWEGSVQIDGQQPCTACHQKALKASRCFRRTFSMLCCSSTAAV
jgi:hypothetical protein